MICIFEECVIYLLIECGIARNSYEQMNMIIKCQTVEINARSKTPPVNDFLKKIVYENDLMIANGIFVAINLDRIISRRMKC